MSEAVLIVRNSFGQAAVIPADDYRQAQALGWHHSVAQRATQSTVRRPCDRPIGQGDRLPG